MVGIEMFAKKFVLTVVTSAVLLGLLITGGGSNPAFAEEQQSPQQVMREIGDKYEVGEILSDKDAELVKKYAFKPSGEVQKFSLAADAQPDNWTVTGSAKNSVLEGHLSGTVYVGLNLWENNFNATITTHAWTGKPTHYMNEVALEAYGVAGAGGIKVIKVADFKVSSGWTSSDKLSHTSTFANPFNASVAYYYITPKGNIKNGDGSLEILGVGKKK